MKFRTDDVLWDRKGLFRLVRSTNKTKKLYTIRRLNKLYPFADETYKLTAGYVEGRYVIANRLTQTVYGGRCV